MSDTPITSAIARFDMYRGRMMVANCARDRGMIPSRVALVLRSSAQGQLLFAFQAANGCAQHLRKRRGL